MLAIRVVTKPAAEPTTSPTWPVVLLRSTPMAPLRALPVMTMSVLSLALNKRHVVSTSPPKLLHAMVKPRLASRTIILPPAVESPAQFPMNSPPLVTGDKDLKDDAAAAPLVTGSKTLPRIENPLPGSLVQ